jgi:hypothetical protein
VSLDLRNIIDPPPVEIIEAAEKVRIWMDSQNRGTDWQLAGVCSREALTVRDNRIADLVARLKRAEADAAWARGVVDAARANQKEMLERAERAEAMAEQQFGKLSLQQGDLALIRTDCDDATKVHLASALRHILPDTMKLVIPSSMQLSSLSEAEMRKVGWVRADPMPNDPLDDVLPMVASGVAAICHEADKITAEVFSVPLEQIKRIPMPPNLPKSLDLDDNDGGGNAAST